VQQLESWAKLGERWLRSDSENTRSTVVSGDQRSLVLSEDHEELPAAFVDPHGEVWSR
jgi:hypothetical protein